MSDLIIKELFKYMPIIGNHKNMSGSEKKKWILNRLTENGLTNEDQIKMISEFIDYIVLVDNRQIIINQKETKKKCFIF